jgi:hypothetical protein
MKMGEDYLQTIGIENFVGKIRGDIHVLHCAWHLHPKDYFSPAATVP